MVQDKICHVLINEKRDFRTGRSSITIEFVDGPLKGECFEEDIPEYKIDRDTFGELYEKDS